MATALGLRGSEALFFPVQRPLLEGIDVPNHENGYEAEHAPKDQLALDDHFLEDDCPGVHEHDFQIEQNEKHGDQVKLHAEAWLRFPLWYHSAFVGSVLNSRSPSSHSQKHTDEQGGNCKTDCNSDVQ